MVGHLTAPGGKDGKRTLANGTLRKRSLTRHMRSLRQSCREPEGDTCPAIMSQRTSAIDVPGEGNEPPVVPTGMLLD